MKKSELNNLILTSTEELLSQMSDMNDGTFLQPLGDGKWSAAQHIGHLLLSNQPILKALTIPKHKLEKRFGLKNDRPEKDYASLFKKYHSVLKQQNVLAPAAFVMDEVTETKSQMIERFRKLSKAITKEVEENWSEEELTSYVLPHPAIGMLTMREFLLFIGIHNAHHANGISEYRTAGK